MFNTAIVFSCDKNYFPFLEVSLYSLIEHLNGEITYQIFILSDDLNRDEVASLSSYLKGEFSLKHFSIELKKVEENISESKLFYTEIHVSKATYLRFYIPSLFAEFKKVLYLDCDLIFFDSIDFLLNFDIEGYCLAAVQDLREEIAREVELTVSGRNWKVYLEKELGIGQNDKYYQAGVLLFNTAKCRSDNFQTQCLNRLLQVKRPILSDQDIINSAMRGKIKQLPDVWNVEYQIRSEFLREGNTQRMELIRRFKVAREKVKILHFASSVKPWNNIDDPDMFYWWVTARKTRKYEQFILQLSKTQKSRSLRNILKKTVNMFFAKGTKRRTILKRILRGSLFKVL